jgi:hypothetical protein
MTKVEKHMHFAKKAAVVTALTGAVLGGALTGAGSAVAGTEGTITIQGTCGGKFDPSVSGGAAGWTISCVDGKVRVQGWVKDTDADGRAAEVYGTWGDGDTFTTVRAGGEGTLKTFDRQHAGSTVYLYLRVI